MQSPSPGMYFDVPAEEYFAWDAVSNSRLTLLKRSALHYKVGKFKEPTKALSLGSLTHCGVLEPLQIARRYCFMPNYAKHPSNRTKNGERSFSSATDFVRKMEDDFLALNHDKQIVSEEDYARVCGVSIALSQNERARQLFTGGKSEVSIVWDDVDTGIRCKARVDYLSDNKPIFADLKTCADALDFEWSIGNYDYHRQMAFYKSGLDTLRPDVDHVPWIAAVETDIPYCNRVAPMSEEALRVGNRLRIDLLETLATCVQSNVWPGYESPDEWRLPEKFMRSEPVELLIGGESLLA